MVYKKRLKRTELNNMLSNKSLYHQSQGCDTTCSCREWCSKWN